MTKNIAFRRLDFDDIGTKVTKQLRGIGSHHDTRHVENANSFKRAAHAEAARNAANDAGIALSEVDGIGSFTGRTISVHAALWRRRSHCQNSAGSWNFSMADSHPATLQVSPHRPLRVARSRARSFSEPSTADPGFAPQRAVRGGSRTVPDYRLATIRR